MTTSLSDLDDVLRLTEPLDESVLPATLRSWRADLVRASVTVSYAIGVLALDEEILLRCRSASETDLSGIVDQLPHLLTSGWVGGGWSLAPDAVESVVAADELTRDYAYGLLELHTELASGDLSDPDFVDDLLARVRERRAVYVDRRSHLEQRIQRIQVLMRLHYATGAASVDDWLR